MRRAGVVVLTLLVLLILTPMTVVEGRLGGGHSFSGGGGGSSSGGSRSISGGYSGGFSGGYSGGGSSSGGTPLPGWCITPLVIGVVLFFVISSLVKHYGAQTTNYSSANHRPMIEHRATPPEVRRGRLGELKNRDPYFSEPVFLDFVCALFARLHEARGRGELDTFHFYLGPEAEKTLQGLTRGGLIEVNGVVVGAARLINVKPASSGLDHDQIDVEFETNYTEVWPAVVDTQGPAFGKGDRRTVTTGSRTDSSDANQGMTVYANEVWGFSRRSGLTSRAPEDVAVESCPNCGSPLTRGSDERCPHCGAAAIPGQFSWAVTTIQTVNRHRLGLMLTETVPEVGTDLPTVYQHDLANRWQIFLSTHPTFDWDQTRQRFELVFLALQAAWTNRQWEQARPYETDAMFQTHLYWIEEYQRQNLRNVLEDIRIERIELAKIESDAFFDALTIRIRASMKDYTLRENGQFVCGDRKRDRVFTEYWTFLRRLATARQTLPEVDFSPADKLASMTEEPTKAGRKTPARPDLQSVSDELREKPTCPNCGAPLTINQAGVCEYCDTKITLGQFDWVLSRIEQDETYRG